MIWNEQRNGFITVVAECLNRAGISVLRLDDLRLFSGIEDYCRQEATAESKYASIIATLALAAGAREDNLRAIESGYGNDVAQQVQALSLPFHCPFEERVMHLLNLIHNEKIPALVLAAAALLHAEFSYYSHQQGNESSGRIDLLRKNLPINTIEGMKLKKLWDSVIELTGNNETTVAEEPESDADMSWMITISLDLAASTRAKTVIEQIAGTNTIRLVELYEEFYRQFLIIEDRFYTGIFGRHDGRSLPLDFRKLFVIKGIGDELWIVYPIRKGDITGLKHALSRIIPAALDIAYKPVDYTAAEKPDLLSFDPHRTIKKTDKYRRIHSPVKVFIDLVENAHEISEQRGEFFLPRLNSYYAGPNRRPYQTLDMKHAEVSGRLNLGIAEMGLRQYRIARRSDYIGHEIDRFFRVSKHAQPGLITLGYSLYSKLGLKYQEYVSVSGIQYSRVILLFPDDPASSSAQRAESYWSREFNICEKSMQGIGYDYSVLYLFNHYQLRGILHPSNNIEPEENPYTKTCNLIAWTAMDDISNLKQVILDEPISIDHL